MSDKKTANKSFKKTKLRQPTLEANRQKQTSQNVHVQQTVDMSSIPPNVPTARPKRQAAMLQMQRRLGNQAIQSRIASRTSLFKPQKLHNEPLVVQRQGSVSLNVQFGHRNAIAKFYPNNGDPVLTETLASTHATIRVPRGAGGQLQIHFTASVAGNRQEYYIARWDVESSGNLTTHWLGCQPTRGNLQPGTRIEQIGEGNNVGIEYVVQGGTQTITRENSDRAEHGDSDTERDRNRFQGRVQVGGSHTSRAGASGSIPGVAEVEGSQEGTIEGSTSLEGEHESAQSHTDTERNIHEERRGRTTEHPSGRANYRLSVTLRPVGAIGLDEINISSGVPVSFRFSTGRHLLDESGRESLNDFINRMYEYSRQGQNVIITGIEGYASELGNEDNNTRLSELRGEFIRERLRRLEEQPNIQINATPFGRGETWARSEGVERGDNNPRYRVVWLYWHTE